MITKKKNMKKTKKIVQVLALATTVVSGSLAFNSSAAHADSIKDIGKGAKVIDSIDVKYNAAENIKNSIKVSFIDDPNTDKKFAIISTEGSNIGSGFYRTPGDASSYYARVEWPSAYKTGLEITSNDSAAFYKVSPKNNIETKNVSSTVAYNVGGGLEVKQDTGASASATAGASWSTTVSYEQPDYKTFLENSTDKKVDWTVEFSKFDNRGYGFYSRDSWSDLYGNQLFMSSRTNPFIGAADNFISNDEFPALVRFGFQPSTLAIVTADKNETSTDLSVKQGRLKDNYSLTYIDFRGWVGNNYKDQAFNQVTDNYTIDWKNNKIVRK
ncbi:beta-channel forming cytolysin [Bacillus cytotoxicus]|uniref:Beta-channel forming cytolysin n=1 Tax=Bacillus cytotoxicus TaxID=580165 RepID=A0ACC6A6C3_9BACI|nr:beta-channel forming cytolysin [Bacillus cytotoxicus]